MMRRVLILLLLLSLAAGAHEGHQHKDLRGEAPPDSGPPRVVTREVTAGEARLRVTYRQLPAEPGPGQEVQVDLGILRLLDPPDPLLGDRVAMEEVQVKAFLDGREAGEAQPEAQPEGAEEAGWYGLHLTPAGPGLHHVTFQLKSEELGTTSVPLDFELAVPRPLGRRLAEWAACALLAGMLVATLVRRRAMAVPWVVASLAAGSLLAWSYLAPLPAPPAPAARPARSEEGLVIPPDLQELLDMKVQPAAYRTMKEDLKVPGQLVVPDGRQHDLHAPVVARVLSWPPRVGARVSRGQPLLELEEVLSSADQVTLRGQQVELEARRLEYQTRALELARQQSELEARAREARSRLSQRRTELRRAEALLEIQAVPKKEVEAARFAEQQEQAEVVGFERQLSVLRRAPSAPALPAPLSRQRYTLSSPIEGVVARVEAAPDEVVEPEKALVKVVDLSELWVEARVPEAELARVQQADRAQVSTPAYPGPFEARFVSFGPQVDPETRVAQVLFAVDNRRSRLLAGMSAEVTITGIARRYLTVPAEAVLEHDGDQRIFVRLGPDRFEARSIKVVRRLDGYAVVESGLEDGTPVVVQGAGSLASELARRSRGGASPSPKPEGKR